jgi:uncharacterized repeat protein (TIGR04138 family)
MTGPNFESTAQPSPLLPSQPSQSSSSRSGERTEAAVSTRRPRNWTEAYADLHRTGYADFPPACLHYVLEVVRNAARAETASTPPIRSILSAAGVIAAFRAATRTDFGALRAAVLDDWGLRAPRDLGRAVAHLGRAGCLIVDEGDSLEHYSVDTILFEITPGVASLDAQEVL